MEQPNNKVIVWKPTPFMIELRTKPMETMAKMAKYSPLQVERKFEAYKRAMEQLDGLYRSQRFFDEEYDQEDKHKHLHEVRKMIAQMEEMISGLSSPRTIGELCRDNSEMTLDIIGLMVNDLRGYMILDRMITSAGIESLCPLIVATYPAITLEEIAICLSQAKKGFYGEDYQRLDGTTIMKWLRLYMEDKQQRLANKQYANEVQYKSGKDIGRTERGDSLKVFLAKATGASILYAETKHKK